MPNNDYDFLEDLATRIREPNQKLLEEFTKSEKQRTLSNKLATKADKLIIRDSKANRKAMMKRPGGFSGRVAKRAGGAVMGGIGNAIGGIPIVGAIFRAIGQEAAATLKDKKNYQRELTRQRKVEHKLMEQYEEARKKKEQSEIDAANPKPGSRTRGAGGSGASSAAVIKLSNAAEKLEAAAISLTPAIQTFDEIVVKINDVVEKMGEQGPNRIRDEQALEYLHAIEFFSQETAATVEKMQASSGKTVGKDIGNIKWHMARANGSAGRIEKLLADNGIGKMPDFDILFKDVANIKWHMARANGSAGRIEALLKKAAGDRLKEIDIEKEQLKVQKKQYESQEETKFIGILGLLTNLMGGFGKMLGGAAGGLAGAMGGKMVKGGLVGAAAYGAFEIGQAIGEELNKYLEGNKTFENFMFKIFDVFDNVLAKMGDPDAIARVKTRDDEAYVNYAQELAQQSGLGQLDPATEDHVRKNHTLPGMDPSVFANRGLTGGMFGTSVGAKSKEEMAQLMQNWQLDQAQPALPGQDLIPASAGLEDAKAEAEAKKATRQAAIQQNSQVNNNNQTVVPQPLSADPAGGVSKSRNLGD